MVIQGKTASSPGDRKKRYYSHAMGGVNRAVRESDADWKWVSVFSTDTLDLDTALPSALDLAIESGQKFVVTSSFRQYGRVTVKDGAVLQLSKADYVIGYDAQTADRNAILTVEPGGTLVIGGCALHVRYGASLMLPTGSTVVFLDGGTISYEGGPESSDLSGTYVEGEQTGSLTDGTRIKAPVLKKFYRQSIDRSKYDFYDSLAEYYNDGDVVSNQREFDYFSENDGLSSVDYVEDESDKWHPLNYFYDRVLLTIPIETALNKASDDDFVSLETPEIHAYYESGMPSVEIKNLSPSTAIPRRVTLVDVVFTGDEIKSGDRFVTPTGLTCLGTQPMKVWFDHRYSAEFKYCSTSFVESAWMGDTVSEPPVENVFTVNGEPFTVNGEDYALNSGKRFVGWFEIGAQGPYDFSAPLTKDVELTGREE